jgi:hypothetical protein
LSTKRSFISEANKYEILIRRRPKTENYELNDFSKTQFEPYIICIIKYKEQYMEQTAQRWQELYRGKLLGVRLIRVVQDRDQRLILMARNFLNI